MFWAGVGFGQGALPLGAVFAQARGASQNPQRARRKKHETANQTPLPRHRRHPPSPTNANSVTAAAVEQIKRCPALLGALGALKEANLEFLVVDGRTAVTDHPDALSR